MAILENAEQGDEAEGMALCFGVIGQQDPKAICWVIESSSQKSLQKYVDS